VPVTIFAMTDREIDPAHFLSYAGCGGFTPVLVA